MSYISISNISYRFNNGSFLFKNLNAVFSGFCALTGNNGSGKSILASVLAGIKSPYEGSVNGCTPYYMLQRYSYPDMSIAKYIDVAKKFEALKKLDNGEYSDEAYSLAEGNWDLQERLISYFDMLKLKKRPLTDNINTLSGAEKTKIELIKALISNKKFYIFDEPTNHMDSCSKKLFLKLVTETGKGTLVISHDRELLEKVSQIYELSNGLLKLYGGNYSFFAEQKEKNTVKLIDTIDNINSVIKKEIQSAEQSKQRQERKTRTGKKTANSGGIPKISAGKRKETSEKTSASIHKTLNNRIDKLIERKISLTEEVIKYKSEILKIPDNPVHGKIIFTVKELLLPYGSKELLNYECTGSTRIGLSGANGAGKTTFLKVLTNEISPVSGLAEIKVPYFYLKQTTDLPDINVTDYLLSICGENREYIKRLLGQINIRGERGDLKLSVLSGGEKMKVMLLSGMLIKPSPGLMILDEPTNHMDLHTILSLEEMIKSYKGALLVVSHDKEFLKNIGITNYINI